MSSFGAGISAEGRRPRSARLPRSGASENFASKETTSKSHSGVPVYLPRTQATRIGLQDITNLGPARDNSGRQIKPSRRSSTKRAASQVPRSCDPCSLDQAVVQTTVSMSSQQTTFAPPARAALPKGSSAVHVPEPGSQKRVCTEKINVWTGDSGNVQYVSEYAPDIFASLLNHESKFLPVANYFDLQTDINSKMRGILVDWLIDVHRKYRMRRETLYLTISTVDRFLVRLPVLRGRLQLVGVVALWIAAKYEEINPPAVEDYVYITDDTYTKEEIIAMECHMLSVLDFQVAIPTVAHLLTPLLSINNCDDVHKEFVCYLTELALLDHEMVRFPPSLIICAAILLSNEMAGRLQPWQSTLQEHTKHTEEQLRPCAEQLRKQLQNAPQQQLQAVCKKYQSAAHQNVASDWPRK